MTLHVSYGGFEDSSTVGRFVILIPSLVFLRECFCIFLNAQLCLRSEFGPEPPTTAPAITRLHPLPKSRTLSLKGRGYSLMLLYDWSISTSIRSSWRARSLSNSDRAPEAQRLARRRRRECAPREETPTVCSHRKKREFFSSYMAKFVLLDVKTHIQSGPRLWQRQATRISAALRGWSLPRVFVAVSCLEARECRCRRLRGCRFVLSGDSWHLCLFPKTRRPVLSPSCPVHPVSLSAPGRLHTHPGAASLLLETRRRHSYLPGRVRYQHSSKTPAVFTKTNKTGNPRRKNWEERRDPCAGDIERRSCHTTYQQFSEFT